MHYIVVTGGVISGLGKGITASSLGLLLKAYGLNVTAIKIDPYLNFDSGLMSPFQHGECYVLDDGGETDLDLGNYERYMNITLTSQHSLTTGKLYKMIYDAERRGDYLGQTVQMIPHGTNFIKEYLRKTAHIPVNKEGSVPDVCIIEVGGTVGDIEGNIFYEAISEFYTEESCCLAHVSLVPVIHGDEIKTKPTQHSIRVMRGFYMSPDIYVLRCPRMLNDKEIAKVERFCKVKNGHIIVNTDVNTVYEVPRLFMQQDIIPILKQHFQWHFPLSLIPQFEEYNDIMRYFESDMGNVVFRIGIVGKYVGMQDTYLSLIRAIEHAAFKENIYFDIEWIDSQEQNDAIVKKLKTVDGVIIPGGFDIRGVDGMIATAKYCRQNNVPLLGICLGMQIMCIEIDCNILGNAKATSEEFDPQLKSSVATVVLSQAQDRMGATMRLGGYNCLLKPQSQAHLIYGKQKIRERHRHRYEISPQFIERLQKSQTGKGEFHISGMDESNRYAEILERFNGRGNDIFYIGCQFHPEYRSRHSEPHPLFRALLQSLKTSKATAK